jgi:hypothetical protein
MEGAFPARVIDDSNHFKKVVRQPTADDTTMLVVVESQILAEPVYLCV